MATDRVSDVEQVKGDDPEEKGYSGPSGGEVRRGTPSLAPSKVDVKTT